MSNQILYSLQVLSQKSEELAYIIELLNQIRNVSKDVIIYVKARKIILKLVNKVGLLDDILLNIGIQIYINRILFLV